jgi:hypothetical protein
MVSMLALEVLADRIPSDALEFALRAVERYPFLVLFLLVLVQPGRSHVFPSTMRAIVLTSGTDLISSEDLPFGLIADKEAGRVLTASSSAGLQPQPNAVASLREADFVASAVWEIFPCIPNA